MGRVVTIIDRFMRGLVTDAVGVSGAVVEARDMVPLPASNGWRVRGGKGLTGAITACTGGLQALASGLTLAVNKGTVYGLLHGSTASGFASWPAQEAGLGTALPVAVSVVALGGRDDEFQLEPSFALFGEEMWVPSILGVPLRWAGAQGGSEQTAGSVSGSSGSRNLTVSGSTFTDTHLGWYIWINDALLNERAFRIVSRTSSTVVVLDRPLPAAAAADTYMLSPVSWWSVAAGTFGAGVEGGALATVSSGGYLNARCVTQHQGRVGAANVIDNAPLKHFPDRYRWSAVEQETDALYGGDGSFGGAEYWHPNAYVDVAPGEGGTGIYAVASFGGNVYWFKRGGVFVGRGFVETDGRDVGFTVSTVTLEDGLLEGTMPVVTDAGIMFCGERGVWLVNDQSVTNVSSRDGSRLAYQELREAGEITALSWAGRRLIVQNALTRAAAVTADVPNTLVWYADQGTWCQQQTLHTTPVISAGDSQVAVSTLGEAAGSVGEVVFWNRDDADARFPEFLWGLSLWGTALWGLGAPRSVTYDGSTATPVLASITSHAIPLGGEMNGRVRCARLLAKLVDDEGNDPEIELTVLLGEEGSTVAIEAGIVGGSFEPTENQTETWHRLRIEGAPPVSSARVRLRQTLPASDVRVYQVGVEHVPVARSR